MRLLDYEYYTAIFDGINATTSAVLSETRCWQHYACALRVSTVRELAIALDWCGRLSLCTSDLRSCSAAVACYDDAPDKLVDEKDAAIALFNETSQRVLALLAA